MVVYRLNVEGSQNTIGSWGALILLNCFYYYCHKQEGAYICASSKRFEITIMKFDAHFKLFFYRFCFDGSLKHN